MLREFRTFLMRGNVIDLAVAVVAGTAFTAIVNSLVRDIITPLIGVIFGKPDFSGYVILGRGPGKDFVFFTSQAAADGVQGIAVGSFLNAVIAFVLVMAGVFFLIVKPMDVAKQRLVREAADKPPTERGCPRCCATIAAAASRCPQCTSDIEPLVTG